ncbi:MAG: peptidase M48 [Planctomycetota bacterium]|nr:MAG: peptidase M48 [Planctomycetota bacterium]
MSRLFLSLLLVAASSISCATVAGTGRMQLNIFSPEEEAAMGIEAYQQQLAQSKVIQSGQQRTMVKQIGARIAEQADRLYPKVTATFQWQFELLDEPGIVNAWALPGGKSAVYTGLLPITQSVNGLAVVMGHEVAHALARHGGERMSQATFMNAGLDVVSALSGDVESGSGKEIALQALGIGTQLGSLAFGRSHESEADEIGLMLMAHAGYDPREAVKLWERMGALSGDRPPEWLSTHPSEQTRIERLQALMPEAMKIYNKAIGG